MPPPPPRHRASILMTWLWGLLLQVRGESGSFLYLRGKVYIPEFRFFYNLGI